MAISLRSSFQYRVLKMETNKTLTLKDLIAISTFNRLVLNSHHNYHDYVFSLHLIETIPTDCAGKRDRGDDHWLLIPRSIA